jgi:hypothetical protein
MSLDELVKGDMPARICRLAPVCSATSIDDNVALPSRTERHVKRSVSLDPVVWSDMSDMAFAWTVASGATFSTAYVASPDRKVRHGHARMSLHQGW